MWRISCAGYYVYVCKCRKVASHKVSAFIFNRSSLLLLFAICTEHRQASVRIFCQAVLLCDMPDDVHRSHGFCSCWVWHCVVWTSLISSLLSPMWDTATTVGATKAHQTSQHWSRSCKSHETEYVLWCRHFYESILVCLLCLSPHSLWHSH